MHHHGSVEEDVVVSDYIDLDHILDRLAKLQERAQDARSPEEAANAAALIEDMLMRYNLTMAQVNSKAKNRSAVSDEFITFTFDIGAATQWIAEWRRSLIWGICKHNFCRSIYTRKTPIVNIVGENQNIRVCIELYKLIEAQVRHLTNVYYKTSAYYGYQSQSQERGWRRSFSEGCVATVVGRIAAQRRETINTLLLEAANTTALVERKDQEVEVAFKAYESKQKGVRVTAVRDRSRDYAYRVGQEAGMRVTINKTLEGKQ